MDKENDSDMKLEADINTAVQIIAIFLSNGLLELSAGMILTQKSGQLMLKIYAKKLIIPEKLPLSTKRRRARIF